MSDMPLPSWRSQSESPAVSRRMLVVAGSLLAGVMVLGLLGWGVSKLGPRAVPVVEAETTPLKERPAAPGGMVVPNQDETIFDRPGERRPEQVLTPNRIAPGPEAPQMARLRQQQQAATQPRVEPPAPAQPQAQQQQAVATPAARPAAPARPAPVPAAAPAAAGRWQVQLGALNSEAAARSAWDAALRRTPELGSRHPVITELKRDNQPTLWRLRVGGLADAAAARSLCEAVKTKGGNCVAVSP
jgi:cell division septation protein DedD